MGTLTQSKNQKKSDPENSQGSLADPGGRRRRPPQQNPFLSFLHMFLLKSVRVGGRRPPPPMGQRLPPTENPGSATEVRSTCAVIS